MDVPALWLLGGRDREIPLDQGLAILKRLQARGKDYTIHVYPKDNHGLGRHTADRSAGAA
jgi:dipeptidyl aminopeptidase/acylaminoacyl peptidase